jgi:hypothetical protein
MLSGKWPILILVIGVAVILSGAALFRHLEKRLKTWVVEVVKERFQSDMELEDLRVSIFPSIRGEGKKLTLWHHGRRDVPPLITLEGFSFRTSYLHMLRTPRKITRVELEGLVIQVPPKKEKTAEEKDAEEAARSEEQNAPPKPTPVLVLDLKADGTLLKMISRDPEKEPLKFELTLRSVGTDRPMEYVATLTNAKPPGLIDSKGLFGPWAADEPGDTPVTGTYVFQQADLSVFKGIRSGILSSTGEFTGALSRLDVKGKTEMPDFALDGEGVPLLLTTDFVAVVDGTNGNTLLQPVVATLGSTKIVCRGGVVRDKGEKGKSVKLDVTVDDGKMEDFMMLAVSAKPLLTGLVDLRFDMEIPPGDVKIKEKLILDGTFHLAEGEFSDFDIQEKVEKLSQKSRGRHDEKQEERIVSDMKGHFTLRGGIITLTDLSFSVPGAVVHLDGQYDLTSELVNFEGTLTMQAKLSQTTTGIKSFLLKIVDPFFAKDGAGAVLPIKVTGTRKEPSFGLNL